MDRISGLPDELLCHILSFLPTKFAFTTTLLSKRWTPLFYSLPVLRFDDNKFKDFQTYDRFYSFLNNLMIHPLSINQAHPLKTFRFKQCYYSHRLNLFSRSKDIHNINTWVEVTIRIPREKDIHIINTLLEVAIQRRVEKFDLKLCFHTLKPIIFISKTLTILKLLMLKVGNDTSCVNLPSLKSLKLNRVRFENWNDYINFLSSCPNLEDLRLKSIHCRKLDKNNASKTVFQKSLALSKLVRLCIGSTDDFFKVISNFSNLIHIKLWLSPLHCWDDVVKLLRLCPKLQILYIKTFSRTTSTKEWTCPLSVLECVSYHLKSCTISTSSLTDWANDIRYVQYILRNARLLQDMTINFNGVSYEGMVLEKCQIIEELSSCPMISPGCKLSFDFFRRSLYR
ncbi:putative FBD-associated F-box protein At5g38570 [Medicago truncatula]|uniref:F-box/RNI/FBD-like domain protein n=2 Tax=Medicago truncatula TaxID=3880 RepID=A0A072U9J3_MEDTR|nr:putative FBD-associated F-box protein At5g38570 [Medicago truncatula]KEH26091.1 F-box/RNI/FBD-like domain protein [Medicago truncatula]